MLLKNFSSVSQVIISIAVMLIVGYVMARVAKKLRLPNVTGYIVAGILIGPYCIDIVPQTVIDGMSFLADIALAFIAFSTGEFFKLSTLKKNGGKNIIVTCFEALLASILVFLIMYFALGLSLPFSIVLGALAAATAPASTMMTIRQTGSKGEFVDTLLQVVALDDVVGLVAFSVAIAVATATLAGSVTVSNIVLPIVYNIVAFVLGGGLGWLLKVLISKRSTDNRLIIAVATILGFCGVCSLMDVSPLLGCMAMGTVYMNVSGDDKLFKQLNYFSPPILLLFFVRSGANFKLDALLGGGQSMGGMSLLVIGVVYFFVRILGKYGGAFLGCLAVKKDKKVRNYLGLALIPQAGVAIGLATLSARMIGGDMGSAMETIILASSVLYELIGPACAKLALYLSKSYSNDIDAVVPDEQVEEVGKKNDVEILIEKIDKIRQELPQPEPSEENEKAFNEGAEEYYALSARQRGAQRDRR